MSNSLNQSNLSKVTWILERNVFAEVSFDRFLKHFKENNIPYHVVTILPFVHTLEKSLPHIEGLVIVYGSIGLQKLAIREGWVPGLWTGDNINENLIRDKIGDNYLNNDAILCRMSDVMQVTSVAISGLDTFFIKPNTDTKEFAGTVMKRSDFSDWYQKMIDIGYLENNDFEVVVSKPKEFGTEYRLVVCDGKIIGSSQYKKYNIGKMAPVSTLYLAEMQEFVTDLEKIYKPYDVYVIDVTETDHGYQVVEYGTFNSAGLYECDIPMLVNSLNDFVRKTYAV